eukprot:scaffold232_cov374-Prasinococcus_capsulatus_cf.AAC.9
MAHPNKGSSVHTALMTAPTMPAGNTLLLTRLSRTVPEPSSIANLMSGSGRIGFVYGWSHAPPSSPYWGQLKLMPPEGVAPLWPSSHKPSVFQPSKKWP